MDSRDWHGCVRLHTAHCQVSSRWLPAPCLLPALPAAACFVLPAVGPVGRVECAVVPCACMYVFRRPPWPPCVRSPFQGSPEAKEASRLKSPVGAVGARMMTTAQCY